MKNSSTFATLIALLTLSSAQAQTCNPNIPRTAPDSRYQLVVGSGGSEVLDTQTQLIWQRCSIGQVWSGTTCLGAATTDVWTDALAKAKAVGHGYRLPNIKELQSLVEEACYNSAINATFFPATPPRSLYWSASSNAYDSYSAWFVYFYDGYSYLNYKIGSIRVRAVRSGQ